jgi:hypothetical protein
MQENASVSDVQDPAVLGHLVAARLMNVRGLHLRPGAHSSYPRAAPGAPLPRYRYPAAAVNYGPSDSERQHRLFIFFAYEEKIKTASEHLFFLGGGGGQDKPIKPKTQFQKYKELEVVLYWITCVSQLVLCDLIAVCLSYSFMAIQVHCSKTNSSNRHGVPCRHSVYLFCSHGCPEGTLHFHLVLYLLHCYKFVLCYLHDRCPKLTLHMSYCLFKCSNCNITQI